MSKGWAGGSTRAQRKQRAAVLRRDQWTCQINGPRCTTRATVVHHTKGIKVSGKVVTNLTDLEAACERCNWDAGDPTDTTPPPNPPRTDWG